MLNRLALLEQQAKYAVSIAFTLAALILTAVFWPVVQDVPFIIPMAAVAVSAWLGGWRPGMLSAALVIVSVDFFLIEPRYRVFTELTDILQLAVFGLVALLISWLEENRRVSAQTVRQLNSELQIILNSVSDGITTQDQDGQVLFANSAAADILGFTSPSELLRTNIDVVRDRYEFLDEAGDPLPAEALPLNHVFALGESATRLIQVLFRETRQRKWLQVTSSPVLEGAGGPRLAVNVIRDVSDTIQGQLDREHLAAIIQNSDDGIISKDLNAVITTWNPGAEQLYGYTADEAIGQPISIIFPEELMSRERKLLHRILNGERIRHYETERLHKDGHRLHISLTISPIRNAKEEIVGFSTIERDFTPRIEHENRIRRLSKAAEEQNRRLETIISSVPGIVFVSSGNTMQTPSYVSAHAEKMLGYPPEAWETGPDAPDFWKKIIHPDDWENATKKANEISQADESGSIQFRCITSSGDVIHVESHIATLKNETGEPVGTCGVLMDVTQWVQAHERLMKLTKLTESQRQQLKNIVENVPGIVYGSTVNPETGTQEITFISDYTKAMLGYEPEEWIKDPYFWRKIIPEDERINAMQKANRALEQDEPAVVQYHCTRADGTTIFVESFFRFHELDGEIKSYGVIMDITERKRHEEEINSLNRQLRIQKRRLDNIIANVPGVVYEMEIDPRDNSRRINYLSPYAEKMLGYPMNEMLNVPNIFSQVVHPEDEDELYYSGSSDPEKTYVAQYRCLTKEQDIIYVESYDRLVYDDNDRPTGAVGVVMDITERKEIEEALDKYMTEITRSNQDLEQFAYVASHDLQEPLRKISSYLQLIEERYGDKLDEDGKDFLNFAVDGAVRMKALINDLLTYSRVQRNKDEFQPVQLQEVVNSVLELLELGIEESEATIVCDELPEICASKSQMIQLFQNLVSNAIKFCGDEPPRIHIGVEKNDDMWQFYVKDNGIGIDPKYFDRIFVIFQRLHSRRAYSGTGIGLAICKKIIDNHSGQMWVESEPGKGTTFYFTLSDSLS